MEQNMHSWYSWKTELFFIPTHSFSFVFNGGGSLASFRRAVFHQCDIMWSVNEHPCALDLKTCNLTLLHEEPFLQLLKQNNSEFLFFPKQCSKCVFFSFFLKIDWLWLWKHLIQNSLMLPMSNTWTHLYLLKTIITQLSAHQGYSLF